MNDSGFDHLPSLENLRCFLAAADHLNFRRAAAQVHLTAAAFGQRIRQLEEQLAHPLFERSTRQVSLTPAGQRLVPLARATLREALRCAEELHAPHGELPVRLMLGTRFELGLSWLVPAIIALPPQLAHIEVELYFGSGPDILERLTRGQLDAIITSAPAARREWGAEFLHREEYALVGAPALLAQRPLEVVSQAREHTLLDIDEAMPLARYLVSASSAPLEFGRVRCCGAGAAILEMTLAGLGVAILPEHMIAASLERGELVRLLPQIQALSDSFRLLFKRDTILARALGQLAAHLRDSPLR